MWWGLWVSESLDMFYLCPVNTVHTLRRIPVCSYDWEVVVVTFDTVLYCTVLYCMVVVTFDTGESPSPAGSLLMQTETELFSHPQTEAFYQPRTGTFSLPKMWMFMPEKSSLLTQWRTRIFSQPKTEIFSQRDADPVCRSEPNYLGEPHWLWSCSSPPDTTNCHPHVHVTSRDTPITPQLHSHWILLSTSFTLLLRYNLRDSEYCNVSPDSLTQEPSSL